MDRQPALTPAAGSAAPAGGEAARVEADQAVFTSVPSPMGRGYRLVAASPGVSADERREIVQRSPSHGNLCDPAQESQGLACFDLASGRRCAMSCGHAEAEHSGRGGFRVHTQIVILDPGDARGLSADPIMIDTAIRGMTDVRKIPTIDARMPRLSLAIDPAPASLLAAKEILQAQGCVDRIAAIASALLDQRRMLVVNSPYPRDIARLTFAALPASARRRVTMTLGLRFSPARNFQLVFLQTRREEVERILCDQPYDVIDWNAATAPPPPRGEHEEWVQIARDMLASDKVVELNKASSQMGDEDALAKISQLIEDLHRIERAGRAEVEAMRARHLPFKRVNDIQTGLHLKFVMALTARLAQLRDPDAWPSDAE